MLLFRKIKATGQAWEEFPLPELESSLLRGDIVLVHHEEDNHSVYCVPFSRIILRGKILKKNLPRVIDSYVTPCPVCSRLERERKGENQLKLF